MRIIYAKGKLKIGGEFQAEKILILFMIRGSCNLQEENSHGWVVGRSEKMGAQGREQDQDESGCWLRH